MKVIIEPYNVEWPILFQTVKEDLLKQIRFLNPTIEHIGSTSIEGLSAKPIIDIMVGIESISFLDQTVEPLIKSSYIYFEKFNSVMPNRRFYVKLKSFPSDFTVPSTYFEKDEVPNELNEYKLAHIHVFEKNSPDWNRHIAFRNYLKRHPKIKNEYQKLKIRLSLQNWGNGSEYNSAKNDFIKIHEEKALNWWINREVQGNND